MEPVVDLAASICRIQFFEEAFPARVAQEQTEKCKVTPAERSPGSIR